MKSYTLAELAEHVGGTVVGDATIQIRAVAGLKQAGEGDISFLSNAKYAQTVKTTQASAVLVKAAVESKAAQLVCPDPYYAFMQVMVLMYGHRRHPFAGIDARAVIAESASVGEGCSIAANVCISENARIGKGCTLYPGVFVGPEATIGDDCILYPNVVVYDHCTLGNRVIIQANATVGEDGFGFSTHQGLHHKIPQVGSVILEDDVELGAGCAIERGAIETTVICQGTKVGDAVVIGHGTVVGPHCLLVPQVGIAGSTTLGHHCVAGGQVGIGGHLTIGNQVMMAGKAGITEDAKDGEILMGMPAFDAGKARRSFRLFRRLPEMWKELRNLKNRMAAIDGQGDPEA